MLNIRNTIWIFLFLVAVVIIPLSIRAEDNPQDLLKQYISDLQKNPDDNVLREKIIKHVQTMSLAPAVPEEAKKYMARGKAAFKVAKEAKDFNDAAEEFKKSVLYAPWLAEGYYNLGIVQDKAGQYAEAIKSLKLYVLAAPNAPDVDKVKELIYEIEYRQEKAAKESSPEAVAEREKKKYDEWLKKLDGARFVKRARNTFSDGSWTDWEIIYEIRGNKIFYGTVKTAAGGDVFKDNIGVLDWMDSFLIEGREFVNPRNAEECKEYMHKCLFEKGTISEDGATITERYNERGERRTDIYRRER